MIEILFSAKAADSMQTAGPLTRDRHRPFMDPMDDGNSVANKTLVPGAGEDIFCFPLHLSIGDISGDGLGEGRGEVLAVLEADHPLQQAKDDLAQVRQRFVCGEDVRIWYSDQPDERCGMYWFMWHLHSWESSRSRIQVVRLPDWEFNGRTVTKRYAWSQVPDDEWCIYVDNQREIPPAFLQVLASRWEKLRCDNAPLRAAVNGRLQSVPEGFYRYVTDEWGPEGIMCVPGMDAVHKWLDIKKTD